MAVRNGNEITLFIEGVEVANAQVVNIDLRNSLTEVTTGPTGGYSERISAIKDASISVSGLGTRGVIDVGTEVSFFLGDQLNGSAVIESYNESGGTDDVVSFDLNLMTTGAIAIET